MKHTIGPWKYAKDLSSVIIIAEHKVKAITDFGKIENHEANARLIAATPDLLQACLCALADLEGLRDEGIFYEDEGKPPQVETIEELEKAINKATK